MKLGPGLACVLVLVSGCKGKESRSASGAGAEPPAKAETTAPVAKLDPEAPFGCFAWSASRKAAACVTGYRGTDGARVKLAYLGMGGAPTQLVESDEQFDHPGPAEATVAEVNAALAVDGFTPLGDKQALTEDQAHDLGNGVTVRLTRRLVSEGGDNEAPTHANTITATCKGKDVVMLAAELEGGTPTAWARQIGDHAIVEIQFAIGREGEMSDEHHAAMLDSSTCMAAKA
jgi:hypothetical protein